MKIVKVILDDGTSIEAGEIKPLSYFEQKHPDNNKCYWQRRYERQFNNFEDNILELLNEENVEEYAKFYFNLVEESDIKEKDISDFKDSEILEEMKRRKLNKADNIITSQFLERFENIVKKENSILLDELLSQLESKLNI